MASGLALDLNRIFCQRPAEKPEGKASSPELLLCCCPGPATEGADNLQFSCEEVKSGKGENGRQCP